MLFGLLNLLLALEADFFVGTLSSNWCRLIDELRQARAREDGTSPAALCAGPDLMKHAIRLPPLRIPKQTWAGKAAHAPYIDVGDHNNFW